MAEHRVELVELLDAVQQRLLLLELVAALVARFHLGDVDHQVFTLGQELVQRRIDRPDRHRAAVHRLEHAVEVVALQRQQLVERLAAVGFVVGQDHLLDDRDAAFAEEHVLGAAQADAARAERVGELGLVRLIGVGADVERPLLVRPRQDLLEAAVDVRRLGLHLAGDDLQDLARLGRDLADLDLAGEAVERHPVAFLDGLAGDGEALAPLSSIASAPAPTMDGLPIWRPTTAACEVMPPVAVRMPCDTNMPWMSSGAVSLRTRRTFLPALVSSTACSDVNTAWPDAAPGEAGRPLVDDRQLLPLGRIEHRRQQLRQRLGLDQEQRLARLQQLLGDEVGRDEDRRVAGALAAPGLQHVELVVLDRELEVLDVLVGLLQAAGDLAQLLVGVRHHLLELGDRQRRADAGDDVLALRVHQELAEELVGAGRRVAGEAHAGGRTVAGVAEHHRLDVDGGADFVRDVVDAAVLARARVVPRAEHGVTRAAHLRLRILRERLAALLLDDLLVARDGLLQAGLVEVGVDLGAALVLDRLELVLEGVLRDLEDDRAEHLDEAAVAVVGEAAVAGPRLQALDGLVVEAEVQDGVHHARHRELRARAHRHEQRLLRRHRACCRRPSRAS